MHYVIFFETSERTYWVKDYPKTDSHKPRIRDHISALLRGRIVVDVMTLQPDTIVPLANDTPPRHELEQIPFYFNNPVAANNIRQAIQDEEIFQLIHPEGKLMLVKVPDSYQ